MVLWLLLVLKNFVFGFVGKGERGYCLCLIRLFYGGMLVDFIFIFLFKKKDIIYVFIVICFYLLILYDEYYIMFIVEKNDKIYIIVKRG